MHRAMKPAILAATLLLVLAVATSSASTLERKLVGTRWRVVSMNGFPEDNVVEGTFIFRQDGFAYLDWVNDAWTTIEWSNDGFKVTKGGSSTDVGADGPHSYLASLPKRGSLVTVKFNLDGSLTLTRDDLVVIAVPLVACASRGSCLRDQLAGTEWQVASTKGFQDDKVGEWSFGFEPDFFSYRDDVSEASRRIYWDVEGFQFSVGGVYTRIATDDTARSQLDDFHETGAMVTVVLNTDGSITMTRDGLVVVGVPAQ